MKNWLKMLVLTSALFLVGCGEPSPDVADDPRANGMLSGTETNDGIECDIQIAKFVVPDGWTMFQSDGTTAAILMPVGEDPQAASRMVSIDVGTPREAVLETAATSFAADYGGSVTDKEFDLGGENAYRLTTPPVAGQIIPRDTVAAVKDGKLILLIYATKDIDPDNVLERVRDTWTWN